ncbi:exosome complex component Rrp46 isoform X2 [Oratosquilla oratoria]|uniref:exosome complex component Rrp46 isoform X2 n=1 Tax=Oratosquilla oratoria TaxID=337810 RepID=UPI003F76BF84
MVDYRCQLNFLSRPDGSALFSIGDTVALGAVFGPGDVRKSSWLYNEANVEVNLSPPSGQSMIGDKVLESIIEKSTKQVIMSRLYPRTGIRIIVQEMQTDGKRLSTCLNAAFMALLDAAISMRSMCGAISCCITKEGAIIIEPSNLDLEESTCVCTFVFEGPTHSLVSVHQEGQLSAAQYEQCLEKCQFAAKDLFNFFRRSVEEKYKKINCIS